MDRSRKKKACGDGKNLDLIMSVRLTYFVWPALLGLVLVPTGKMALTLENTLVLTVCHPGLQLGCFPSTNSSVTQALLCLEIK